ncbi:LAMI_0E03510g1_1 [Lachancea mirantina]|uniref:LAMI_0E03510g1_1 n=1 Tax=Lachancea mirantina TaxID=1230905 RepID=A0A1G4JK04_9SACH|nr:LAMI_0E03510g1_1 [Lachancea mirantina]
MADIDGQESQLEARILEAGIKDSSIKDNEKKREELLQNQQVRYFNDLFEKHQHLPVKVSHIAINNSQDVRTEVLQSMVDATVGTAINLQQLCEKSDLLALKLVSSGLAENAAQTLDSRGTFKVPLDSAAAPNLWSVSGRRGSSETLSVIDVVPKVELLPVKKFSAKTGTNVGNGEGDGYLQFQWRNAFGGGEKFTFDATKGTKTHSSYLLAYSQPVSPWWFWDSMLFKNSREMGRAELLLRGIKLSLRSDFIKGKNLNHELSFESVWRSTKAASSSSSNYLLSQCGDDLKNALSHSLYWDTRNSTTFPTRGSHYRVTNELALGRYVKSSLEAFKVRSWLDKDFITTSFTLRGGYLKSFSAARRQTHFADKFHVGGSNDVRSFQLMGLGPKDHLDSMGGDAFLAYGFSTFSRLPIKRWSNSSFRLHAFFNGGRLISHGNSDIQTLAKCLFSQHSTSMGLGLVFAHPMVRFEINFTVPLTAHSSDSIRKGFQYGIGLSFL